MAIAHLHTDDLERRYGPIHAVVIRHDCYDLQQPDKECIREVKLIDDRGIVRTYAITFLDNNTNNNEFLAVDNEVRHGGMIGKTFRKYGYEIERRSIGEFTMAIPRFLKQEFRSRENDAVVRLNEFYARKNESNPLRYGTIIEIISPDFVSPANVGVESAFCSWKDRIVRHFETAEA